MIDRILDLFRASAPLVDVAPALRALGVEDVTDLAVVELAVVGDGQPNALLAWVEAWPFVAGLGKPHWPSDAAARTARLERLAARGAIVRDPRGRLLPTPALLALVPGHPRLQGEGGAPPPAAGVVDVDRAKAELDAAACADPEVSPCLAAAVMSLAAHLAPVGAHDRGALEADLAASSVRARRLALSIAAPAALQPASALGRAVVEGVEHAVSALSPLADDAEGARVLDALRLLLLRFADAVAHDFDPAWLGAGPRQQNELRREELVRRFARWAGLDTASAGAVEPPRDALARLLRADHRREALFGEELAHRARLEAEAQKRIDAEKKRRDAAAESYSSGRRE